MPNISNSKQLEQELKKLNNVDILKMYDFTFFKSAFEAFIWQLTIRFRKFRPDFPVYLFNSGDEAYLLNEQRTFGSGETFKRSDIYQTKPRFEIQIADLQVNSDQFSAPTQEGIFILPVNNRDVGFHGPVKRVPINFEINGILVCDSLLHSFTYLELLLTMLNSLTTYEFWHAKRRHNGVFSISTNLSLQKNLELSYSADSRDFTINVPITLQLQFPAFDFFNPLENSIKAGSVGVINDFVDSIYPSGGTGDQNGDNIEDGPIFDLINNANEDNSSDANVGNVHNPQPIPGLTNPDGSIANPNSPTFGQSDTNTGWKDKASTQELSSDVLDVKDKDIIGIKTHYPM